MDDRAIDRDGGLRAQSSQARADCLSAAGDLFAFLEESRWHTEFLLAMHGGAPELAERWRVDGGLEPGGDGNGV